MLAGAAKVGACRTADRGRTIVCARGEGWQYGLLLAIGAVATAACEHLSCGATRDVSVVGVLRRGGCVLPLACACLLESASATACATDAFSIAGTLCCRSCSSCNWCSNASTCCCNALSRSIAGTPATLGASDNCDRGREAGGMGAVQSATASRRRTQSRVITLYQEGQCILHCPFALAPWHV